MNLNLKIIVISFLLSFFFTYNQSAKELLIYADNISYDSDKNLIARGNAKIISEKEIITSELAIIDELKGLIIFPKEFKYKDDDDNYYYGSSGEFSTNFTIGKINDLKMILKDGSRIVGKEAYREGKLD